MELTPNGLETITEQYGSSSALKLGFSKIQVVVGTSAHGYKTIDVFFDNISYDFRFQIGRLSMFFESDDNIVFDNDFAAFVPDIESGNDVGDFIIDKESLVG